MAEKSTQSTPNNYSWLRRAGATLAAGAALTALVACSKYEVASMGAEKITSDKLAERIEKDGCPVDDQFKLEAVTLKKEGKMAMPPPIPNSDKKHHPANLYSVTSPDTTESFYMAGGIIPLTNEEVIDTSKRYDIVGPMKLEDTAAGVEVCVMRASVYDLPPPPTTS